MKEYCIMVHAHAEGSTEIEVLIKVAHAILSYVGDLPTDKCTQFGATVEEVDLQGLREAKPVGGMH